MTRQLLRQECDVLVIGAGAAGLRAALAAAEAGADVLLVHRDGLGSGSTAWAQGGIAAAIGPDDHPELHLADTLAAADGLADPGMAAVLVEEAPRAIAELVRLGARFDRQPDGSLALGLEGGHSRRRIVHAGGAATGAEVARTLWRAVETAGVRILGGTELLAIATSQGRAFGAVCRTDTGMDWLVAARATVLASGGYAALFSAHTVPTGLRGQGLIAAYLAGAAVGDLEFVQFHPTALAIPRGERLLLLSEALRGEGAILVDGRGRRILEGVHPAAELAPRHVVARRIAECLAGGNTVWLDCRPIGRERLVARFPNLVQALRQLHLDPAEDPLPVRPAAHFTMGGVLTDQEGGTTLPGLYAAGEVALTGVHGASRLASNSLLECLVFGRRAGEAAARAAKREPRLPSAEELDFEVLEDASEAHWPEPDAALGMARQAEGLRSLYERLACPSSRTALLLRLMAKAALLREESRGAHVRLDHPGQDARFSGRFLFRKGGDGPAFRPLGDALFSHPQGHRLPG